MEQLLSMVLNTMAFHIMPSKAAEQVSKTHKNWKLEHTGATQGYGRKKPIPSACTSSLHSKINYNCYRASRDVHRKFNIQYSKYLIRIIM